jgi:hypothetical protein
MLMVPVLLIVVAEILRARERRARRAAAEAAEAADALAAAAAAVPVAAPPLVPVTVVLDAQSSPDVGVPYAERYEAASYDPTSEAAVDRADGVTVSRQRV